MEVDVSVTTSQVQLSMASTTCRTTGGWSPASQCEGVAEFDPGVVHVEYLVHGAALGHFLVTISSLPHIPSSVTVGW
jgi:hypothetical protein